MKRGALCAAPLCDRLAARTVEQTPYCEHHAEVVERTKVNIAKHKPLLDRLAEDD